MVDPTKIGGGLPRVQEGTGQPGRADATSSGQGATFKALLEKLDGQARQIQQVSEQVDRPDQLAGAVDQARDSLDEALSLGNQLLEAFRANQLQTPNGESAGTDTQA